MTARPARSVGSSPTAGAQGWSPRPPGPDDDHLYDYGNQCRPVLRTGVTLTDPTPTGLVPMSVTGACSAFPCALGALVPGDVRTVTATLCPYRSRPRAPWPIANTATVSASTNDPDGTNNSHTATTAFSRDSCDVDGDGRAEFITGAGPGGGPTCASGGTTAPRSRELYGFFAYDPAFPGGALVACTDVTGDGIAEVITGAGPGGGPHVRVWHYTAWECDRDASGSPTTLLWRGVRVAAGDVTGDGLAEIITGAGPGGGPHVRIWSWPGAALTELHPGFWGYAPASPRGIRRRRRRGRRRPRRTHLRPAASAVDPSCASGVWSATVATARATSSPTIRRSPEGSRSRPGISMVTASPK